MKTKDEIILSMCMGYSHDFYLKEMSQRALIYVTMKELYERCIEPHMEFKRNNVKIEQNDLDSSLNNKLANIESQLKELWKIAKHYKLQNTRFI